ARRMLKVLESQRRLRGEAYPPTLRRLAELCEVNGSDTRVPKAATHALMADRAVVVARAGKRLLLDAPVVLKEDLEESLPRGLPGGVRTARPPPGVDQLREARRPPERVIRIQPRGVRRRAAEAPHRWAVLARQP